MHTNKKPSKKSPLSEPDEERVEEEEKENTSTDSQPSQEHDGFTFQLASQQPWQEITSMETYIRGLSQKNLSEETKTLLLTSSSLPDHDSIDVPDEILLYAKAVDILVRFGFDVYHMACGMPQSSVVDGDVDELIETKRPDRYPFFDISGLRRKVHPSLIVGWAVEVALKELKMEHEGKFSFQYIFVLYFPLLKLENNIRFYLPNFEFLKFLTFNF